MVEPPPSDVPEIIVTPNTKTASIPIPKTYQETIAGPYRRYFGSRLSVENSRT